LYSSERHHELDTSQAQTEVEVQPNALRDDFLGKEVAAIRVGRHPARIACPLLAANVTVPKVGIDKACAYNQPTLVVTITAGFHLLTPELLREVAAATRIEKKAIRAPRALNDAVDYGSAFSRGLRLEFGNTVVLLISGTASIDENGKTVHVGDIRAQLQRTFANITALLESEGATWKDIVRTTCYLRDIDRDYRTFNEERTRFYQEQGLDPLPASTGIQAVLCRPDLLVEIEAVAIFLR
jgi:2-iminobutanoate/2-iminopropanoate deaminase